MIKGFNCSALSVSKKKEHVYSVLHLDAQLLFMLNVREEKTIAWSRKEEKEISVTKFFVKNIDHLR
jgi:hypothetical protein